MRKTVMLGQTSKKPAKGVTKLLITDEELDQHSKEHHDWLVKFVKDADEETLRKFLRYATGADVICVQHTKVVCSTNYLDSLREL